MSSQIVNFYIAIVLNIIYSAYCQSAVPTDEVYLPTEVPLSEEAIPADPYCSDLLTCLSDFANLHKRHFMMLRRFEHVLVRIDSVMHEQRILMSELATGTHSVSDSIGQVVDVLNRTADSLVNAIHVSDNRRSSFEAYLERKLGSDFDPRAPQQFIKIDAALHEATTLLAASVLQRTPAESEVRKGRQFITDQGVPVCIVDATSYFFGSC